MDNRIEILKDGVWTKLRLQNSKSIKYNAIINKIGEPSDRQIGSTNTFSLPKQYVNIQALGINEFNQYDLAKALNIKYQAKYYIEEKIVQEGYLLINNTLGGKINVNFIDKSLDIISRWGSITYKELLENSSLAIPSDYAAAIAELYNYSVDKTQVLTPLSEVGSRGYNLCLFPNNLNAIGDGFQEGDDGDRFEDAFNPYQSRPIFNAISLFDLACERFGYTAIFDSSVDWDTIKTTYFIAPEADDGSENDNAYSSIQYETIANTEYQHLRNALLNAVSYSAAVMKYPSSQSIQPNQVVGWVDNVAIYDPNYSGSYKPASFWRDSNTVFTPNLINGNVGDITFKSDAFYIGTDMQYFPRVDVVLYWYPTTVGNDVISEWYASDVTGLPATALPFPSTITQGSDQSIDITIDKGLFDAVPAGADRLIGVSITYKTGVLQPDSPVSLSNMIVSETNLNSNAISFDDYGQYEGTNVDLIYGASTKTLKTLLSSVMHKEGILMNIYSDSKEIKFFTYEHYEKQVENEVYLDWTSYHLRYSEPEWKTNYGNNYGKINNISLADPYNGNVFPYQLVNQGEDSRYKDVGEDKNNNFKDVENVIDVSVNGNFQWTEYTSKGLGLVEYRENDTRTLNQFWINGSKTYDSQGTFTDLPIIANVNYGSIPQGVIEWYTLIDEAVRCKAKFLIPVEEIRNLDLSKPIYVGELGGFYIIEKVSEYVNSTTPVTVNLIKLISELDSSEVTKDPEITLSSGQTKPDGVAIFKYTMTNVATFSNYIPTGAILQATGYTDYPENGGTLTGNNYTTALTLPPYNNNTTITESSDPALPIEEGIYECVVTDATEGISSNITYVDWLSDSLPEVLVNITQTGIYPPTGVWATIQWTYANFNASPTASILDWQLYDPVSFTPIGPLVSQSISLTSGSQDFDFGAAGFYRVWINTNEAIYDSSPGGWVIVEN